MGRLQSIYCLIIVLLLSGSANAQMPAHIDSLVKFTSFTTRLNVPVADTNVWRWAVNTSLQNVCRTSDAYPKLDTVTLKNDSTQGGALPADFLRIKWVMKIKGDSIWYPMGAVGGDTLYLQVVDSSDAKLKDKVATQPKLYLTHGVGNVSKLFTHPKYKVAAQSQTFIVAYWARDLWLRDTTPDSSAITDASIKDDFLGDVVNGAAQIIAKRRLGLQ
jgi:hypothetical protein